MVGSCSWEWMTDQTWIRTLIHTWTRISAHSSHVIPHHLNSDNSGLKEMKLSAFVRRSEPD